LELGVFSILAYKIRILPLSYTNRIIRANP